ncbi:hypothetical protein FW778_19400 [Ginsengibacter hankyongi]|uniref:Glycosyltransferase family 1 protein n=1 Tax=Ginsengibacter hankyongi TaxID=2607284 RepID=A0A5J5IDT2_9BACT|nr:hypothetical protein [Ginsengibacter hankyongi]KAA9036395.1 hypothetical protein FW778_19400 [Ginsengibacter hankyongi]
MKIAILTRPDYRSPRVLAETLKPQLQQTSVSIEIFYDINFLNRLVSYRDSKLSLHFWLKEKLFNYISDKIVIKKLGKFDAVVISECSPNGFVKSLYNVERFKKIYRNPVLYYEVYYLGNAPSQINKLRKSGDAVMNRYDLHLSVSEITEIRQQPSGNWFNIGLYAKSWNLTPVPKKEMIAIIDFEHPGYETYRQMQISALQKVGIKYISLEKSYSIEEIRSIYQQGSIYFMQSPEAFGLPILECLCCGNQIFTHSHTWPMSWRLHSNPGFPENDVLPECFTVCSDEEELVENLSKFKKNYHPSETPQKVFQNFIRHYPSFYHGNEHELQRLLNVLKAGRMGDNS